MFPNIEPYERGLLAVGDSQEIYWECSGNPNGRPIVYLHGARFRLQPTESLPLRSTYLPNRHHGSARLRAQPPAGRQHRGPRGEHHAASHRRPRGVTPASQRGSLGSRRRILGFDVGARLRTSASQPHNGDRPGLRHDDLAPRSGMDHARRRPHLSAAMGTLRRRRRRRPESRAPVTCPLQRTALQRGRCGARACGA